MSLESSTRLMTPEQVTVLHRDESRPGHLLLRLGVPAVLVDEAFAEVLKENLERLRLQSYRGETVSEGLAQVRVPDGRLRRLVTGRLVPPAYKRALAQLELNPLGAATSKVLDCRKGRDLVFEVALQITPLIPIKGFRGFWLTGERPETGAQREAAISTIVSDLLTQVSPETLPSQLREGHARLALRKREFELSRFGTNIKRYLEDRGLTPRAFAQELAAMALVEARLEVLYRSIAHLEGLSVSKAELGEEVRRVAQTVGRAVAELAQGLREQDRMGLLVHRLLVAKVRAFLLEHARFSADEPAMAKAKSPDSNSFT